MSRQSPANIPQKVLSMRRASAAVAVSAGIIALAACTDATGVGQSSAASSGLTTSYAQDVTPEDAKEKKIAFMPTKDNISDAQKDAGKGKPGQGTGIYYHGGQVLQSGTKVVAIYWSGSTIYNGGPNPGTTGSGASDGSLIGHFLRYLGGSPYFHINSSYTGPNGGAISDAVTYTSFWANSSSAPSGTTKVTDAQMVAMLQAGFDSHAIAYDANTLYLIFTSGKVNLGGGFGTSYCGYHTNGTVNVGGPKTALYAAMPYDYAYPGSCTNGSPSPNLDPGADGEVSVLAHEIEETTTDMMGNAWYDNRGYENADKCAWTWGSGFDGQANITLGGKRFLVQQNWKNTGSGGCGMTL
jgi:hypothetical protein